MANIFLTHPPEALANYYGDRAVAGLKALGEVRFNPAGRELSTPEVIAAARGCEVIVSYRQTPGEAALFEGSPDLVAFSRCAIDIRNVDVPAASAAGILVTQASAGFVAAVSEWVIGAMVDLDLNPWDAAATREVDWVSGACLMVRRQLLERLGAFDPAFFMYFEDVDLCRRLSAAGHAVWYVGDAVVVHHTRGSTLGQLTPGLFLMEQRSRLRYFRKHYGVPGAVFIRAAMGIAALWHLASLPFHRGSARASRGVRVNLDLLREALTPARSPRS